MKRLAVLLGVVGAMVVGTATPSLAFQCAYPGTGDKETLAWALSEAPVVFEATVHTVWRDDTYEPPNMWTSGAVYARATVTRTLRGEVPNEVLLYAVKMECEGCPDDGAAMVQSLRDKEPMRIVAGQPKRVGDVTIYGNRPCVEEALSYAGWFKELDAE